MKRFFVLFVSLVLTTSVFLCGCSISDADREGILKDTLETTYDDLSSTFSGDSGEYSLVSEYLYSWAKTNKMEIEANDEHYMVLVNPATEGCGDKESTVLQCSVKTKDYHTSMQPLAVGLTALLGPDAHGKISLIITENDNGNFIGASSVDPKYYQCDNFINLDYNNETALLISGAKTITSVMSADISTTSPSYTNAYAITMTMPEYTDPFDFDTQYPNPVEVIGSLLATEKSSGQLFQLSSFNCKANDGYTPSSATAVVVVDSNDVESFTKKFNKSYENMKERFDKLEDHFVYTMTETSMPSAVMTNSSSDNIISLMYTLKTGIYYQDEETGDIITVSDTSSISTENNKLQVTLTGRSIDDTSLEEMSNTYLTTSGLCDIQYQASDIRSTWTYDKDKDLASYFMNALSFDDDEKMFTFKSTECDIFTAKEAGLNAISYKFAIENGESALMNLTHFIQSRTEK